MLGVRFQSRAFSSDTLLEGERAINMQNYVSLSDAELQAELQALQQDTVA